MKRDVGVALCLGLALSLAATARAAPELLPLQGPAAEALRGLVTEYHSAVGDQAKAERLYADLSLKITEALPKAVFAETWVALGENHATTIGQLRFYADPARTKARADYVVHWKGAEGEGKEAVTMYFLKEDDRWRIANICYGMPSWWRNKSADEVEVLRAAERFVESWRRRDYPSMYDQLPDAAKAGRSAADFGARWKGRFYPVRVVDIMMPRMVNHTAVMTVLASYTRTGRKAPRLLTLSLWASKSSGGWKVSCERLPTAAQAKAKGQK